MGHFGPLVLSQHSDLCVVLLPGRWNIIYVLLRWWRMSGWYIVLILVCFHCIVDIHLSNPGRNDHLGRKGTQCSNMI